MKRTAIGRGRECDIRIKDSSDKISRKQCVITTSFTGKMRIYDTSANGTFLKGERVPVPEGSPLKKGDSINFAHVTDFDWSSWKDPYRRLKLTILTAFVAAAVIAVMFIFFADKFTGKTVKDPEPKSPAQEVVAADTVVSAKIVSPVTDPMTDQESSASEKQKIRHRNIKNIITDPVVKPKEPVEEPVVKPDPRLNGGGAGGDISDDELNRRRKM